MTVLYQAANVFFFVFHVALIVFNLFGWIFRPLRRLNLVTLSLTAFSWFVLGIFYGFGYCFLTDWHWAVREKLGYPNPYNSYVQFLVVQLFNIEVSAYLVDLLTASLFFIALISSIMVNIRDTKKRSPR